MEDERLHRIWHNMKTRCNNPNYDKYQYYGGKGVKVCDEWNEYPAFKEWAQASGYTDTLTLDRIDTNGDYTPENCRWATIKEQANNRTTNHLIEYNGEQITIAQASQKYGVPAPLISRRLRAGWSVERTMTEPGHKTNYSRNITWNGKTQRLYEWAEELNIGYSTLQNRLNLLKWPVDKAFTTPVIRREN